MDFTTNYCGIYWNDGRIQPSSRNPKSKPVDEWDETCYDHDLAYAFADPSDHSTLSKADELFYNRNVGKGVKRTIGAYLVKHYNRLNRQQKLRMNKPPFYGFGPFGNLIPPSGDNKKETKPEEHNYCPSGLFVEADTPVMVPMRSKENEQTENFIMAKINKNKKKNKNNKNKKKANPPKATPLLMKPVSTIHTAPVSMGNTVRGTRAKVVNISDGCRVTGRDYAFSLAATASTVVGWTLIGGMPLTPAVLPSSILRNYTQMYAKFHINRILVHYITSSPTSQAGDVMFYYERDRKSPMCDYSNSSFLPYVLSDPHTVIGPQWTNHTLIIKPTDGYNVTNYGMNADLNEDACGSIFMFSKTNATNSPGYVLIDYDITFKELCVNPRTGILPVARGQWNQMTVGYTATAVTAGSTNFGVNLLGKDLSNSNSVAVSGLSVGDIYKVIFDVTNSQILNTWTNCTSSNLIAYNTVATTTAVTIDDGFTCYCVFTNNTYNFFPSYEAASSYTCQFKFNVTATVTFGLIGWYSLVGYNSGSLQSSY